MLRSVLDAALRYSPAQPLASAWASRQLTVLAYHGIKNPQRFDWQLSYLREHCTVVDLDQATALLQGRAAPERRPVLITFDDGERSLVEEGLDVLRRHGLPAVAFVVAGLIGTNQPYWWTEVAAHVKAGASSTRFPGMTSDELIRSLKSVPNGVRMETLDELRDGGEPVTTPQLTASDLLDLQGAGVEIGNHSLTHPCLDTCDEPDLAREIGASQSILSDVLGDAPRAIAYPNGNHNARVRAAAAKAGLTVGFAFDHRIQRLPAPDLMAVSRVRVASHAAEDRFATIVSGLHPAVHHLRGRS